MRPKRFKVGYKQAFLVDSSLAHHLVAAITTNCEIETFVQICVFIEVQSFIFTKTYPIKLHFIYIIILRRTRCMSVKVSHVEKIHD